MRKFKLNEIWITRNGDTAKIIELLKDGAFYARLTSDGEIRLYEQDGSFSCPELDLMDKMS